MGAPRALKWLIPPLAATLRTRALPFMLSLMLLFPPLWSNQRRRTSLITHHLLQLEQEKSLTLV